MHVGNTIPIEITRNFSAFTLVALDKYLSSYLQYNSLKYRAEKPVGHRAAADVHTNRLVAQSLNPTHVRDPDPLQSSLDGASSTRPIPDGSSRSLSAANVTLEGHK